MCPVVQEHTAGTLQGRPEHLDGALPTRRVHLALTGPSNPGDAPHSHAELPLLSSLLYTVSLWLAAREAGLCGGLCALGSWGSCAELSARLGSGQPWAGRPGGCGAALLRLVLRPEARGSVAETSLR